MRRFVVLLGAAVVVLASLYTGYWFLVAHQLREGLEPWADARRAEGFGVAWRSAEISGFPFAIRLSVAGASWQAVQPFPYDATSDRVVLEAAPWNLRRWHLDAPKGADISAIQGVAGFSAGTVSGTAAADDRATVLDLTADTVSGRGVADGDSASSLSVHLDIPARPPQGDRDPFISVNAQVTDATLPQAPAPFAQRIDSLSLTTTVRGPVPAAPLISALTQWRDAGGTLDIEGTHIAWNKTSIDLAGTLALDSAMQPEGALTATIAGGDSIVDAIVTAGKLDPRYAAVAKSVLRAIAEPNPDGSETLHVPLSLQDQRLYLGPAPIAALPRLTWR